MKYKYSVKVINSNKKTDYDVQILQQTKRFDSLSEVRNEIASVLKCSQVSRVGFVEPGHGLKGKQWWLLDDGDLQDMYENFKSRTVLFWCIDPQSVVTNHPQGTKRPLVEPGDKPPKSKRDVSSQKISDVEAIVKQLEDKHGSKYTIEQMNAWAHMLQMKKHSSYDVPPDMPYFTGSKKKQREAATGTRPSGDESWSPRKRVNLRSECINQLDKWHGLLEKGAITQQQFDELQKTILKDIFDGV